MQNIKPAWGKVFVLAVFAVLASLVRAEYGAVGVLMLYVFYFFREKKIKLFIGFLLLLLVYTFGVRDVGIAQVLKIMAGEDLQSVWPMTALLAYVPMYFYNGERGKYWSKYIYYFLYPVHLFGIYVLIRLIMKIFA